MTADDPRWQQLRTAFSVELEERVRALNQLLLGLERGVHDEQARADTFDALFREAHSLKGAARAVDMGLIEQLAHRLESALAWGRHQPALDRVWFDAAYGAADLFVPLFRSTLGEEDLPADLPLVIARLEAQTSARAAEADVAPPGPPPTETPGSPGLSPPVASPAAQATSDSVRVAVNKLDALLANAGELTITHLRVERRLAEVQALGQTLAGLRRAWRARRGQRARFRCSGGSRSSTDSGSARELDATIQHVEQIEQETLALLRQVQAIETHLRDDAAQLGRISRAIDEDVMAARLLPLATLFSPFERMTRDLAHDKGKDVVLVVNGADIEIDRQLVEQLRDPLIHMIRNAVDHGIEPPAERQARGKSPTGILRLTAQHQRGSVALTLEDDGKGLDPDRLREVAVARGLLTPDQARTLDSRAAEELIFQSGFSTSDSVTDTSGRGVGMDVVRARVEALNGYVSIWSRPGQGTRFTLMLPLTLATTRAILVQQGGRTFALPSTIVERSERVRSSAIVKLEGRRAARIADAPMPLVDLADVLELPHTGDSPDTPEAWRWFFVLRHDERRVGVLVEHLVGEQEIVVKNLGWPLRRVRNITGATVLGSGQTVPILNPVDLAKSAQRLLDTDLPRQPAANGKKPLEPRRPRILIADDSLTTRTLERAILEAAGYETTVAADGLEALTILRSEPIDLVVSDVDMPRLDGFDLTLEIRRDERLHGIPVVLVTSLDAREHRERGVAAGADAYLVKAQFDQDQLLQTVGRLI